MTTLEMEIAKPPFALMQLMHSRWAVQTLKAAVKLNLFEPLSKEAMSAKELARALSIDEKGCLLAANALSALGFLVKSADKYSLNQLTKDYLVKESPLYMGEYIIDERVESAWGQLSQALSSGKPVNSVNLQEKAEEFFPKLAASIFPMNYGTAHQLAQELNLEELQPAARVLDIAAGSGVWSLPLAERKKDLLVEALDFPAVLEVTKRFAERHKVSQRYSYHAGSWSDIELKSQSYDIVILGHILHSEGKERSKQLLKKSFACLKEGGRLVIAEIMAGEESKTPAAELFALNMFLLTEAGCVFSEKELEEMLLEAGFKQVQRPQLPFWESDSPLIIARK